MEDGTIALTKGVVTQTSGVSTEEKTSKNTCGPSTQTTSHTVAEQPMMDTAALITLVRRAPALAALREQPLDRRDLEEYLSVSKPTVHRLTRTLGEMGLVEKSGGLFVLTRLGEAVADVVSEFTRNVETAYRLAPLFEIQYPTLDISAFTDATVTTAVPGDPYRPMQRYYSLVEQTATLRGFDTTVLSPEYVDAIHRQVRDGMETELIYPPAVAAHLLSAHPERVTELFESGHLVFHVHVDLPHGLTIFDERVGIGSYCETTGALRAFIDTDAPAAREWAEEIYESYWTESEPFETEVG